MRLPLKLMASDFNDAPQSPGRMVDTRWTQVLRSQGSSTEAKLALKDLTAAYYEPVRRFIGERVPQQDAHDLTQEFFARVLEKYGFDGADPKRGRFRSFLLGAVKHFLSEQQSYHRRQKRGGAIPHQSLDSPHPGVSEDTHPGIQVPDDATLPPDSAFDRHWAHTVLERALARLESDCIAEGKGHHFTVLQPWLTAAADIPQADAAKALGLSDAAIRVAIHRLRQRFRGALRTELAQTIGPHITVEEELQHLFGALS